METPQNSGQFLPRSLGNNNVHRFSFVFTRYLRIPCFHVFSRIFTCFHVYARVFSRIHVLPDTRFHVFSHAPGPPWASSGLAGPENTGNSSPGTSFSRKIPGILENSGHSCENSGKFLPRSLGNIDFSVIFIGFY